MLNDFDLDKESPFQPGKPVSSDYFKGRTKIIKKILRYLNKLEKCDVQHYFITGKKVWVKHLWQNMFKILLKIG